MVQITIHMKIIHTNNLVHTPHKLKKIVVANTIVWTNGKFVDFIRVGGSWILDVNIFFTTQFFSLFLYN